MNMTKILSHLDELVDAHSQAVKGAHFQFKSEQEWESSDLSLSKRFMLNTKTLANNLSNIPFYERQNLPKKMFSTQELRKMEKEIENFAKCENQSTKPKEIFRKVEKLSVNDDQLNEFLFKNVEAETGAGTQKTEKNNNDLEDWLDSVLDD